MINNRIVHGNLLDQFAEITGTYQREIRQISEEFWPEVRQIRDDKDEAYRYASDRIYDPFR